MDENKIKLHGGHTLYWEDNKAGGRTYYSDEISEGVVVWDTCLVNKSTLLTALAQEEGLSLLKERRDTYCERLRKEMLNVKETA